MIPPILPPPLPPEPIGFGTGAAPAAGTGGGSFADTLQGAIGQMEQLQTNATQSVGQLIQGTGEDVHASMIAVEKSDLAFGMMLQLRNKAVEAYQDIAQMNF